MYRGYIIGGVVIAFFSALFFVSPFLQNLFFVVAEDTSTFATEHTVISILFFVILSALSAMISPFSSVPVVPIAVSLWGWEVTAIFLLLGWLIGDSVAYFIGFFAGHPFLRQFIGDEKAIAYKERFLAHITFPRAFLIRLALPAEVGYAFGIIKYNFWLYLLATLIAEIPFVLATVQAADALVALKPIMFIGWLSLLIVLVGTGYFFFHKGRGLH